MRWERLLADLAAAEAARERADMIGEAADRTRRESALVTMESRLLAAIGAPLLVELAGGTRCSGRLDGVGKGWFVLDAQPASWAISTQHVVWIDQLPRLAAPTLTGGAAQIYEKLGLRHVLRGIAADRSAVRIGVDAPHPLTGTIDRVGADFIDVAIHPVGEPRRQRDVQSTRTVFIDAIRYVHRGAAS